MSLGMYILFISLCLTLAAYITYMIADSAKYPKVNRFAQTATFFMAGFTTTRLIVEIINHIWG